MYSDYTCQGIHPISPILSQLIPGLSHSAVVAVNSHCFAPAVSVQDASKCMLQCILHWEHPIKHRYSMYCQAHIFTHSLSHYSLTVSMKLQLPNVMTSQWNFMIL